MCESMRFSALWIRLAHIELAGAGVDLFTALLQPLENGALRAGRYWPFGRNDAAEGRRGRVSGRRRSLGVLLGVGLRIRLAIFAGAALVRIGLVGVGFSIAIRRRLGDGTGNVRIVPVDSDRAVGAPRHDLRQVLPRVLILGLVLRLGAVREIEHLLGQESGLPQAGPPAARTARPHARPECCYRR